MDTATPPIVLMREDTDTRRWRHYMIVRDVSLVLVEMTPAILGWNVGKITEQGDAEWPGMSAEAIATWKEQGGDTTRLSAEEATRVLAMLSNRVR